MNKPDLYVCCKQTGLKVRLHVPSPSPSPSYFIIVSMETGRFLTEWVRNLFCKKMVHLHSHNDNNLTETETETVRVNGPLAKCRISHCNHINKDFIGHKSMILSRLGLLCNFFWWAKEPAEHWTVRKSIDKGWEGRSACLPLWLIVSIEFFAFNTKLPEMTILASKDFTAAKKMPPVGLDLMITRLRDYHWFKSIMANQVS